MQFAIHRLGFRPEEILVMGWSIGGYSATWLAMNYPDIKGLVGCFYSYTSYLHIRIDGSLLSSFVNPKLFFSDPTRLQLLRLLSAPDPASSYFLNMHFIKLTLPFSLF
jgi:pimeloyl-ACP methyl ester carboxylesterase